ncbi:NAD(P)/FAD-dependent oxidoreductase [Streptosporangium roseum]|uniref:Cyclic nucleotide-regulated FAD-dependent pyridine nucleotide-disulphide oxidoreductase n=1 Tax=Streptosporangium roseum (strain ATCC 12428 / DSM 43021 / JCM 3005 / KCTC 9067 / NCIMB 10171 / NRRL 2505 / NI 9100) TaxID=479432 RepID=D2BA43_STRRD|nr:NAD(P)/FAD-dependent oxidoreductase [Streptosporangium roseum]ACZ86056.1 cyclic nucleotide-regulated FAD-dependent pyridine nucleotide-disulphide oxidoreductase [Streptosporangium roseum DSM 43021]
MTAPVRILIVGGGYVGMYVALRLQRKLRRGEARITVVNIDSYMTYQPFLPEAAAGNVEARHVVVSLRRVLNKCEILNGWVVGVDPVARTADLCLHQGPGRTLEYDILVFAPGSISRTLPIPGLAESGIGFKSVEEAIHLRDHVLAQLDLAESTTDRSVRAKALSFVFVGAGYAGVEALAELEDMARDVCRYYPTVDPGDMRWLLVEATDRILPEVGPEMGRWTLEQLRGRGIDVRLGTRLNSAVDGHIVLDDGTEFDADTLVWTAGVKPNPLVHTSGLPLDDKSRVKASADLIVEGFPHVFTAGDCAAVPDLTKPGEMCAPNAQNAVRQARTLADNVVATLRGRARRPYRHAYAGSVATLGLHKGVAQIYGRKLRGLPAWFMHRTYHLSRIPTVNKKVRVLTDWTLGLFFKRETVSLGAISDPRQEFELAIRTEARVPSSR